jgi:lambda repressor-like predicted transcriptional regulator
MNTAELAACQVQIGKWVAKRDRLVREARDEGLSLRAIADAAGLSHTAIAKILERN